MSMSALSTTLEQHLVAHELLIAQVEELHMKHRSSNLQGVVLDCALQSFAVALQNSSATIYAIKKAVTARKLASAIVNTASYPFVEPQVYIHPDTAKHVDWYADFCED